MTAIDARKIRLVCAMGCALATVHCGDNHFRGAQLKDPLQQQSAGASLFRDAALFRDPDYAERMDVSRAQEPVLASRIDGIKERGGTAVWITRVAHLWRVDQVLGAARQQSAGGRPVIATFVVYNLPDRDCAAGASAGEFTLRDRGMARYQGEFIDVLAQKFAAYSDVRIAIIMEPDSLPNFVTNRGVSNCSDEVLQGYRTGVVYAIRRLALPNVSVYLDVAHAGWLGWDNNRNDIAKVLRDVLDQAGGEEMIRGFATNVANYTPLVEPDPSPERRQSPYYGNNPAMDELSYIRLLAASLESVGITRHNFIIDTGRNGNPRARMSWGSWCNVAAAKLGAAPTADPAPAMQIAPANLDAYLWIKPPGESDGACSGGDSMPGSPQAGLWFHEHFKAMITD